MKLKIYKNDDLVNLRYQTSFNDYKWCFEFSNSLKASSSEDFKLVFEFDKFDFHHSDLHIKQMNLISKKMAKL